jgi:hypothetical protein
MWVDRGAGPRYAAPIIHTDSGTTTASGDVSSTLLQSVTVSAEDLLNELRNSRTDLARFVEAADRDQLTRIIVPQRSVDAWERREPETWLKVRGWLTARGIAIVLV